METEERNNILNLNKRVEHEHVEEPCSSSSNESRSRHGKQSTQESVSTIENIGEIIKLNLHGSDLIVCSFVAALKSYRIDCCLRPFPQYFLNANSEKDFSSLRNACDKIPPLQDLLSVPSKSISDDVRNLLKWLFIDSGFPVLKPFPVNKLPLSVVNEKTSINALPQYVFEVTYNKKIETMWKNRIGNRTIFYAFHGSFVENFFSICKFGLQQHFNRGKEVIFGNGIYLSNEISVCTMYAPFGETWKKSVLGNKQSIIAICEVINDETEVKCKDEKNKKREINENSYGAIPEKYFVVTNSELVKVKYLLVYRHKAPSVVTSFIKKHFLWIAIILYFALLVFIGILNGPYWRKFTKYFY